MLSREECIAILTRRIENLKAGSGDYFDQSRRNHAIEEAEATLADHVHERDTGK